jgi:ribose-phosphate pyrophosphokinase
MLKKVKIFSCNANKNLALDIANELGLSLGLSEVKRFSDGEINMRINETVRDDDIFIVQSTSPPVNENLMELLIMIDAMRRASAGSINAVIPYFGYARQDRKLRARDPISAKLVADIITSAGATRILTMDLHCAQIQGFFNIPVDHLVGQPLFVEYFKNKFNNELENTIIVSPDFGSVARARNFAAKLSVPIAIVDKRREEANVSEVLNIIGDVSNRSVILVDDIIDTAGTIVNAACALKERGAKKVFACCTHALLSGNALEKINSSVISELVMLDTINLPEEKKSDKIKILSVASVFAKAIKHVHEGLSVSELFN